MTTPFPMMLRRAEVWDTAFIVHSWMESFKNSNRDFTLMPYNRYKGPMRRRIHGILGRSAVWVACDPEQPSHILGFFVGELTDVATVHFAYTLLARRGYGVQRQLSLEVLRELGADAWAEYSHATPIGVRIADSKGVTFNGFAAREAA